MTDTLESLDVDTRDEEVPEEVAQDDLYQLAHIISEQVDWVLSHKDHKEANTIIRNEFRQMQGSASRIKDARQEAVERKLQAEESQQTLEELS